MTNPDKRDRLIQMVRKIQNASACVVDFDAMLSQLEEKIQDREVSQLIFDPPSGKALTAEEIVDLALARRQS
jgi:hypothetical protein